MVKMQKFPLSIYGNCNGLSDESYSMRLIDEEENEDEDGLQQKYPIAM